MVSARNDVFVTVGELREHIASGAPVTVLDVRWTLAEPDGEQAYLSGHLPGAVYVSLDDDLTDHRVTGRGRHPLPSGTDLQAAARRWGVRNGVPTVVYDDWNRAGSARAWWVLTAAGIDDVRILDGGLSAWSAAGEGLQSGPVTPEPGDVDVVHDDLYHGALRTLTAEAAQSAVDVLLDARAPERFRGDVEPRRPGGRPHPRSGQSAQHPAAFRRTARCSRTPRFARCWPTGARPAAPTSARLLRVGVTASAGGGRAGRSRGGRQRCIRGRGRNGPRTSRPARGPG